MANGFSSCRACGRSGFGNPAWCSDLPCFGFPGLVAGRLNPYLLQDHQTLKQRDDEPLRRVQQRPQTIFMSLHKSLSLERRKALGPLLSGALGPARMAF